MRGNAVNDYRRDVGEPVSEWLAGPRREILHVFRKEHPAHVCSPTAGARRATHEQVNQLKLSKNSTGTGEPFLHGRSPKTVNGVG